MDDKPSQEINRATTEATLAKILHDLAITFFSGVVVFPDIEVSDVEGNGPAWLNELTGTIFIDSRVAPFQRKLVRILILHELIHWKLYLEGVSDPADETSAEFLTELSRLEQAGAYTGLL